MPGGLTASISSGDLTVVSSAGAAPKNTSAPSWNPEPPIRTAVPPRDEPVSGVTLVTTGSAQPEVNTISATTLPSTPPPSLRPRISISFFPETGAGHRLATWAWRARSRAARGPLPPQDGERGHANRSRAPQPLVDVRTVTCLPSQSAGTAVLPTCVIRKGADAGTCATTLGRRAVMNRGSPVPSPPMTDCVWVR